MCVFFWVFFESFFFFFFFFFFNGVFFIVLFFVRVFLFEESINSFKTFFILFHVSWFGFWDWCFFFFFFLNMFQNMFCNSFFSRPLVFGFNTLALFDKGSFKQEMQNRHPPGEVLFRSQLAIPKTTENHLLGVLVDFFFLKASTKDNSYLPESLLIVSGSLSCELGM